MSRKDYKVIAEAIAGIEHKLVRAIAANVLATALKADNPRFDAAVFHAACETYMGVKR